MKFVMALCSAALLATAGPAGAEEPIVLTDAELDRVTAGVVLLLPAVQAAREAARDNADNAPVLGLVETRDGTLALLLTVQQSAVPNTPAGPKLGLRNLARGLD